MLDGDVVASVGEVHPVIEADVSVSVVSTKEEVASVECEDVSRMTQNQDNVDDGCLLGGDLEAVAGTSFNMEDGSIFRPGPDLENPFMLGAGSIDLMFPPHVLDEWQVQVVGEYVATNGESAVPQMLDLDNLELDG